MLPVPRHRGLHGEQAMKIISKKNVQRYTLLSNLEVCPKCGTSIIVALGIGPYCPNKDCDVIDNLLGVHEPLVVRSKDRVDWSDRYTVMRQGLRWHIKAGTGTRSIVVCYRKVTAMRIAMELLTAFMDGKYVGEGWSHHVK